jgi:hypothetical protein
LHLLPLLCLFAPFAYFACLVHICYTCLRRSRTAGTARDASCASLPHWFMSSMHFCSCSLRAFPLNFCPSGCGKNRFLSESASCDAFEPLFQGRSLPSAPARSHYRVLLASLVLKNKKEYCIPNETRTHALRSLPLHLYLQSHPEVFRSCKNTDACSQRKLLCNLKRNLKCKWKLYQRAIASNPLLNRRGKGSTHII